MDICKYWPAIIWQQRLSALLAYKRSLLPQIVQTNYRYHQRAGWIKKRKDRLPLGYARNREKGDRARIFARVKRGRVKNAWLKRLWLLRKPLFFPVPPSFKARLNRPAKKMHAHPQEATEWRVTSFFVEYNIWIVRRRHLLKPIKKTLALCQGGL